MTLTIALLLIAGANLGILLLIKALELRPRHQPQPEYR